MHKGLPQTKAKLIAKILYYLYQNGLERRTRLGCSTRRMSESSDSGNAALAAISNELVGSKNDWSQTAAIIIAFNSKLYYNFFFKNSIIITSKA